MVRVKPNATLSNKIADMSAPYQKQNVLRKRFKTNETKEKIKVPQKNNSKQSQKTEEYFSENQFKNLLSLNRLIHILYTPTCPSSIAIARVLFGFMMVLDIPDERGLSEIDIRYGNPLKCHFPLFDWMAPLPLEYMGIIYFIMWIGAAGICLGYKFKLSCIMFTVPYWYIFLLDKTTWNNHSYLFGLVSILFTFSSAHHAFSLDSKLDPSIRNKPVPLWNYAIIRFQFFLLYFYAGLKKFDLDWIGGHSMTRLSMHWVFDPFRLVLSDERIDFWIIHIFGFLFDLTVGFFLLISKTRPIAIVFSSAFHLMNSRMFHIGQFPYVCLCMTPIFCSYDWPDRLINWYRNTTPQKSEVISETKQKNIPASGKLTFCLLLSYVFIQLFLPFSHFITKGYNNWTNGLYGYSWDMMVHNWDSVLTVIKVVDNDSGEEFFIDPNAWVGNMRFSQHGDMLVQYAGCLKRNLPNLARFESKSKSKFTNISVYTDVWCSLNGRFQQRMFNPNQDIINAEWHPFQTISWLMPLISDLTPWRQTMTEMENNIKQQSNESGILFVADFPGLHLHNYISPDLTNVTITVLQGTVVLEKQRMNSSEGDVVNRTLHQGENDTINSGEFHTVYTVSLEHSCYMYSYVNKTIGNITDETQTTLREYDSLLGSLKFRFENLFDSLLILRGCFNKFFYNTPIPIRTN